MSKELEDLNCGEEVKTKYGVCYAYSPDVVEEVKKSLRRLEEINNANPSEALECLDRIDNTLCLNNIKGKLEFGIDTEEHTDCDSVIGMTDDLETIKQALMERIVWKNIHNTKVKVPLCDVFNNPIPLSKEERYKYIEHIYYHWEEMKESYETKIDYLQKELEQALLKAQEHNSLNLLMQELDCKDFADLRKYARCGYEKINKKYLKWEDLEFEEDGQETLVLLNDTKYRMYYYKGYDECINLFTEDEISVIHIFEGCSPQDKQFFNDLHLERVEE